MSRVETTLPPVESWTPLDEEEDEDEGSRSCGGGPRTGLVPGLKRIGELPLVLPAVKLGVDRV